MNTGNTINDSMFVGKLVRLAAPNPERDAEAISRWSLNTEFLRYLDAFPARYRSPDSVKEEMRTWDARPDAFTFMILTLAGDRVIGFIELDGITWNHGEGWIGLGIGDRADWGKGYGTDALQVIMRYAFTELGLHRLSLSVFEYNGRARRAYEKAGFTVEGTSPGFLNRDGQRWDMTFMGILRSEWERRNHEPQA